MLSHVMLLYIPATACARADTAAPLGAEGGRAPTALCQAEDLPAARTAFAVLVLPAQYRVRWRTTNGMERLNEAMHPIW